jgi:hypothetical protein
MRSQLSRDIHKSESSDRGSASLPKRCAGGMASSEVIGVREHVLAASRNYITQPRLSKFSDST